MEQNKEYNAVKDVIGKLEQQRTSIEQGQVCYSLSLSFPSLLPNFLSLVFTWTNANLKDLSIVRREVEDHFERCIHSLEVRRDTLLTQLDEIAERQGISTHFLSMSPLFSSVCFQEQLMQDVMEQIQEAIQNCTEVMRSGSMVYKKNKATAENIWQVWAHLCLSLSFINYISIQHIFILQIINCSCRQHVSLSSQALVTSSCIWEWKLLCHQNFWTGLITTAKVWWGKIWVSQIQIFNWYIF